MEIDICKIYNDFWDKNEINKITKPEHINIQWTGLELEMFLKFAIEQVNDTKTEKEECTLHFVVRSFSEIENRIAKLNEEVEQCLTDFINTSDDEEQGLIASKRISIEFQIKHLKWVIGLI